MASPKTVKVDKKELENAQKLWEVFGAATKWCVIAIVISLVLLAIITL